MQLTDSFYAINYIIPFDSQIFIAGASKNKDNITNQQNNIPYIEPTNYIFSIDEGEHSLVYETQEFIKSVAINNKNYFLYPYMISESFAAVFFKSSTTPLFFKKFY